MADRAIDEKEVSATYRVRRLAPRPHRGVISLESKSRDKRGPLVFLDYTQEELDAAYDQDVYEPNLPQVVRRWSTNSETTRRRIGHPERVAYGSAEIEKLDIYRAKRSETPVFVFVHGGAWARGSAKDYGAPAEMFVRAGAHFIVLDFSWVQDAGGSLLPIADQIRRGIAWTYRNIATFGGDPSRLYIGGHSSGAHLAAVALTTDWKAEYALPVDVIKGCLCSSGMYDLGPVRLSARSSYVHFTDETVETLSPIRHLNRVTAPVIISYGTCESPEFQRQAREFAAALTAARKSVQLIAGDNYCHMELPETLCNPYGLLGSAVLELMKLTNQ